jgi:hypothetical protein
MDCIPVIEVMELNELKQSRDKKDHLPKISLQLPTHLVIIHDHLVFSSLVVVIRLADSRNLVGLSASCLT